MCRFLVFWVSVLLSKKPSKLGFHKRSVQRKYFSITDEYSGVPNTSTGAFILYWQMHGRGAFIW